MDEVAKIAAPLVAQEAVKLGKKLLNVEKKEEKKKENKPKPKRDEPKQQRMSEPKLKNGPLRNPAKGTTSVPSRVLVANPRTYFKRRLRSYKGGDSAIIEGCDLAGSFAVDSPPYTEMLNFPISPLSLPNTRISVEAQLWQKFQFEYVDMIYVPMQGTSTNGSVLLSSVQDPEIALPKPGTLSFAQALASVKGANITQVFLEAHHLVEPPKTDKREFYVYPDQNGEDRFTVQGILKVLTMASMTISPLCMVYLRYKIRFYERVLAAPALANSGTALSYEVTTNGTAVQDVSLKLTDNGVLGSMDINFNAFELQILTNTVYAIMFNLDRGGIEPMQYYYFKMTTITTPVKLRTTAADANGNSGEAVSGSWFPNSDAPANANALILQATLVPGPGKHKSLLLTTEEQVAKQAVLLDQLTTKMEELNTKLEETTYREVRQLPPLFGGRNNTKGV